MPRSKRVQPTACIVCHRLTIYPDAKKNHPYGAAWENRCFQCGSDQEETIWFATLYSMPTDMLLTLQCPFIIGGERCPHMHTFPLGDLLTHTPPKAQFRCPQCDTWGVGEDLLRSNMDILKKIVAGAQV